MLTVVDDFRWSTEFRGLATLALELGLGDLPGVYPVLPDDRGPPSVRSVHPMPRRVVEARFSARGPAEALVLELELCQRQTECTRTTATGSREHPWGAFAALLTGAATLLDIPVEDATRATWAHPGSADTYAELLTGRAGATWLGLLPPSEAPGDRRRDPIAKAVYLDPAQPIAQWIYARDAIARLQEAAAEVPPTEERPPARPAIPDRPRIGDPVGALKQARLARPASPLLAADLAIWYSATGHAEEAAEIWQELATRDDDDPRWFEPYAETLLALGRPVDANAVLDKVPADFAWDANYARLHVQVAEARVAECATRRLAPTPDCKVDLDPLLEHWQRADIHAVEPVRRRLQMRVEAQDYEGALPLVVALRARAPGPQTDALHAALLVAAGHLTDASERSPTEVAARLRARALREADPAAGVASLPVGDVPARLANADAALWRNDHTRALEEADAILGTAGQPGGPAPAQLVAAWGARAQALEGLGRAGEAAEAWRRAWQMDPAFDGGPVGAHRIASTFRFDEVVLPTPVAPTEAPRRVRIGPGL